MQRAMCQFRGGWGVPHPPSPQYNPFFVWSAFELCFTVPRVSPPLSPVRVARPPLRAHTHTRAPPAADPASVDARTSAARRYRRLPRLLLRLLRLRRRHCCCWRQTLGRQRWGGAATHTAPPQTSHRSQKGCVHRRQAARPRGPRPRSAAHGAATGGAAIAPAREGEQEQGLNFRREGGLGCRKAMCVEGQQHAVLRETHTARP
eukprot:364161-Chlamydomonas_euryale.AAC.1